MKNIHTKLFRIGGVWQLGFPGLKKDDSERLKALHGFRYNPRMQMWHISHHVGTVNFLNNKYDGIYFFFKDNTDKEDVPDIEPVAQDLKMRIVINSKTGRMILSHSYHTKIFSELRNLSGITYSTHNRQWIMNFHTHYKWVLEMGDRYGFSIDIEEEQLDEEELQGKGVDPVSIQLMKRFEKELFIRNHSNRTIESYSSSIRLFVGHFKGQDFQQITNEEIRDYIYDLGSIKKYSHSTLNIHISAIKTFYRVIFNIKLQQVDVPRPKKGKALPKVITEEQVRKMIETTPNVKHRLLISLLYSTAIRRDELLSIDLTDLDIEQGEILISGKGNKERKVYFSETLRRYIRLYLKAYQPQKYLFEGPMGRYSGSSVSNIVESAAKRAGIEQRVTPHMLRHSFATHMLRKGVGLPPHPEDTGPQ